MTSATIKLFLPHGDASRFRTAEVSNWTGKALAAPRTELNELLAREELQNPGVYFLFGTHPESGDFLAYIGEAEVIRERLKQHKTKEFWVSAVAFVSKDENLTKGHVKYLENRLIEEVKKAGRYQLDNVNLSGSKLPESDREDMEIFLARIRQVLPVLGSDLLVPVAGAAPATVRKAMLFCRSKGAEAKGARTESGFVVYAGSTAVPKDRPSAMKAHTAYYTLRQKLIANGILVPEGDFYKFAKDTEFGSPSAAAAVICGGGMAGPVAWKDEKGRTLREIDEG